MSEFEISVKAKVVVDAPSYIAAEQRVGDALLSVAAEYESIDVAAKVPEKSYISLQYRDEEHRDWIVERMEEWCEEHQLPFDCFEGGGDDDHGDGTLEVWLPTNDDCHELAQELGDSEDQFDEATAYPLKVVRTKKARRRSLLGR